MLKQNTIISNKLGLHARAASKVVSLASKFESETQIVIFDTGVLANCKSIMGIMAIEGYPGSELKICAVGSDSSEALEAIELLFINRFNEDIS